MGEVTTANRIISESSSWSIRPRIGCAGWTIPRESGCESGAAASHLQRYAQVFNACEINSSFYRPHRNKTWERWSESVPSGFQFSVKAPRTITHESKLDCGSELLTPFVEQISFLKDKLGPILFQLPPSLKFLKVLARRFLSLLRKIYPGDVVWEPRHPSWFTDEVEDLLKEFRIARVATDPACVASASHPGGHTSLVYFRLHGSPRLYYAPYSDQFLSALALQIAQMQENLNVWCIFDNTALGSAVPNALTLRAKLEKLT